MKRIIIPEDILAIGRKKRRVCIVKFCIFLLASVLVLILANDWLNSVSIENKIITYIFFFILPFVLSGFPYKLMDKTWYGKVVKAELRKVLCKDYNYYYRYIRKWKPVVDIIKYKDDFLTETTTNVALKEDGHLDMYREGSTVVHVYGCDYLYVMPLETRDPVVCVVCGMKNFSEENEEGTRGFCKGCGHSLDIKIEEA